MVFEVKSLTGKVFNANLKPFQQFYPTRFWGKVIFYPFEVSKTAFYPLEMTHEGLYSHNLWLTSKIEVISFERNFDK